MRLGLLLLGLPLLAGALPRLSPGFQFFYRLDYDRAVECFEQETRNRPEDPEAWNHLAQGIFYRRLFLEGALDGELVGASNSFLSRSPVAMPEEERTRFLHAVSRSLELSAASLKRDAADLTALYAEGVAHAHRAQFRMLVEKAYLEALRDATRSRKAHARILQRDPNYGDALLIPGMHEYVVGSLSPLVRLLASLTGAGGNREKGMRMMRQAVEKGQKTAVEARVFLALAHSREGQPAQALALLQELSAAFPENWIYQGETALMAASAGQPAAVEAGLAALERIRASNAPAAQRLTAARIWNVAGTAYLRLDDLMRAERAYREAAGSPGASPEEQARARLGLAWVHDLRGNRDEALRCYRDSLRLAPAGSHLKKQAEAGLARPYRQPL